MKNLSDKLDDMNARDAEKGMTRRNRVVRRLIAPVAGVALLATGGVLGVEAIKKADGHNIEYLQDVPQAKDITVEPGDTPNDLVNKFNEGGLEGQERQDVIDFVQRQGAMTDPEGHPMLRAGQTVNIPELSHEE